MSEGDVYTVYAICYGHHERRSPLPARCKSETLVTPRSWRTCAHFGVLNSHDP
jgi:hypothetical protein